MNKKRNKAIRKKTKKKSTKKATKKSNPIKKQSAEERKIGRRRRSKFRPEFKERSLMSFSMSLFHLEDISDILKGSSEEIDGFNLVSSCSSLAHAFEMLSKAILKRVSPYLLLAKLDQFDNRTHKLKENYKILSNSSEDKASYCVGRVAFSRALKLLKKPLDSREVNVVLGIINKRNIFEHRDNAHIVNYDHFLEELIEAMRIFKDIYTKEFRSAHLFNDIKKVSTLGGLDQVFDVLDKHFSERMKKIIDVKRKKEKSGVTFSQCNSCLYELAELKSKNLKECLWCGHQVNLKKCSFNDCDKNVWTSGTKEPLCNLHRSIKLLESSRNSLVTTINLNNSKSNFTSTMFNNPFEGLDLVQSSLDLNIPTVDIQIPSIDLSLPEYEVDFPDIEVNLPEVKLEKDGGDDEDDHDGKD